MEEVDDGAEAGGGAPPAPKKRKRMWMFIVYHGDKAARRLPHSVRLKCPRNGTWEQAIDGLALVKATFVERYNAVHAKRPLAAEDVHLVDRFGNAIADDDVLALYATRGGLLHLVNGRAPPKPPSSVVLMWGYNSIHSAKPLPPTRLEVLDRFRVKYMDCGWLHAASVLESGAVFCWGSNEFGQLGTGDEIKRPAPTAAAIPRDEVRMARITCGAYFTLALTSKGELYSWGRYQPSNWPRLFADSWCNGYESKGEMGIKGEVIMQCSAGEAHMAVLTKSQKVFTWGYNEQFQLGWGERTSTKEGQQKPRPLNFDEGELRGETPVQVSCGGAHTALVTASGKLLMWGSNSEGQSGHMLRQPHGQATIVTSMETEHCANVACGRFSTVAITKDGRCYFWGSLTGSAAQSGGKDEEGKEEGEAPSFGTELAERASSGGPSMGGATALMTGAMRQCVDENAREATVGEAHGIIVGRDNQLRGWGYNAYGQALGRIDKKTDIIGTVQPVEVDLEPEDRQRQAVIGQVAVGGGATYVIVGSELMTLQRSAERNAAETITLETCLQSLQTAVLYNVDDLKEASLAFIAENRKEVFALYAEQIAALPSDCRMAIQASAARRSLSVARRFS